MDKNREEFEKWAIENYRGTSHCKQTGFYNSTELNWAWDAWQAARDCYAPKKSDVVELEKEMIEIFEKMDSILPVPTFKDVAKAVIARLPELKVL